MTNSSSTSHKSSSSEFDARVGQAWSKHFASDNDGAIEMFARLLNEWPEHVDANFGYALCLKVTKSKRKAREAFLKTRQLIEEELKQNTDDISRQAMLLRIVDQHLATLPD